MKKIFLSIFLILSALLQTRAYGQQVFDCGSEVVITATAATGYHFVQWQDGNTDNPRSVEAKGDITYTATFALDRFTVKFVGFNNADLGSQTVEYGKSATAPDPKTPSGYSFTGWDKDFSKITSNLTVTGQYKANEAGEVVISNDKVISAAGDLIDSNSDIIIALGSALIVNGNAVQQATSITQNISLTSAASIIACSDNLSSDMLKVLIETYTGTWYYLCFPFDVPLSSINSPGQYVIYEYDGAIRAQKGSGGWVRMQGSTLEAKKGYIFQASANGTLSISIANPAFTCQTQQTTLPAYASSSNSNANWSLIGNPFPSYYDMQALHEGGFNAPVYIRSKDKDDYDVYMPADDEYHFHPYEAFFVQNPNNTPLSLQWLSSGCETENQIRSNAGNAPRQVLAAHVRQAEQNRYFVELSISGDNGNDHTRVVFNEAAMSGYELGRDAVKMEGSAPVRIFTHDAQTQYAINERPDEKLDIALGYTVAQEGDYKLMAYRMDTDIELYDSELNVVADMSQGGYLFHSEAGTNTTRFSFRTRAKVPTSIYNIWNADEKVSIYTLTGITLYEDVMLTDIDLQAGVYIIKSESQVQKVIVK